MLAAVWLGVCVWRELDIFAAHWRARHGGGGWREEGRFGLYDSTMRGCPAMAVRALCRPVLLWLLLLLGWKWAGMRWWTGMDEVTSGHTGSACKRILSVQMRVYNTSLLRNAEVVSVLVDLQALLVRKVQQADEAERD